MSKFKFLILFLLFFLLSFSCTLANELRPEKDTYHQKLLMETGFRLLNCSHYENRMTFFYDVSTKPEVKIQNRAKRIIITAGVMPFVDNEDEMAAVLSTAIAQLIDVQNGFFRRFSISFSPRKYEVKADKKAVDLMINAGYNPIAVITMINKTASEPCLFEYNIFHHKGTERTAYIYRYIYEKYPLLIAENEYLENDIYQNFLRTTKKDRKETRLLQQEKLKQKQKKQ